MKVISDEKLISYLLESLNETSILDVYQPLLAKALCTYDDDPKVSPERIVELTKSPGSDLTHLFMPCIAPGNVGVKVISGGPANAKNGLGFQGSVMVLDEVTGELLAVVNGKSLTAFRTALASTIGLAKVLDDKSTVLPEMSIFGSGPQAFWHAVLTLHLVPQLKKINIISRSEATGQKLAKDLESQVAGRSISVIELANEDQVQSAVANSSVIYGCTPSTEAVIKNSHLNTDASIKKYIGLIGSYKPHMIELDLEFINHHFTSGRTKILVDSKENALAEAGELIQGKINEGQLVSIADLDRGNSQIDECITDTGVVVLKVVGLLIMDIVMARYLMADITDAPDLAF